MMRDEAFHAILEAKYARIISAISELHDVSSKRLWTSSTILPYYHSSRTALLTSIVVATDTWLRKFGMRGISYRTCSNHLSTKQN